MGASMSGRYGLARWAILSIIPLVLLTAAPRMVLSATSGTTRVSVSTTGQQANNSSGTLAMSANGRYVAFTSVASNLVPGDTNGNFDVFVRDRHLAKTVRVSVSTEGQQAAGESSDRLAITPDGRFVAFSSGARNLTPELDRNSYDDVFVRDRDTDRDGVYDESGAVRTVRITNEYGGGSRPSLSATGRYVAYEQYVTNPNGGQHEVFVRDRDADADGVFDEGDAVRTTLVSVSASGTRADNGSVLPSISANGRYVAFMSGARNLVAGDTNLTYDIFVRDLRLRQTTRVSVAPSGAQGNRGSYEPKLSATGRYVVFSSDAQNLVGRDTNGYRDAFIRDRDTDGDGLYDEAGAVRVHRVSVSSAETQGDGDVVGSAAVTPDGRYVAFSSGATNLVTEGSAGYPNAQLYVRDRRYGTTAKVSVSSAGAEANASSYFPALSVGGRYVAFVSEASNLVAGDTNNAFDIFLRDRAMP